MKYTSINIHGKEYYPVSERVKMAHDSGELEAISTEIIQHNPVVIKATVHTKKGIFTGLSAANPSKTIEKQSPYEVAETSAVGRALGFAGFGIDNGIASADEIKKAGVYDRKNSIIRPSKGKPNFPDSDPTGDMAQLAKDNEELL